MEANGNNDDRKLAVILTALAIVVGGALTLILTSGSSTTATSSEPVAGGAIEIADFKFDPPTLEAQAGQEIKISNSDSAAHTVTADDGSFDSDTIDGGQAGSVTIDKPGTYTYYCKFHAFMKGTVEVK